MSTKKINTLESPSGEGKVYRGEALLSHVLYKLQVTQEIKVTRGDELPGIQDIRGSIIVVKGEKDLTLGDELILHLSDGRRWKFFARSGDPVSGTYQCVNTSADGITKGD